MKNRRHRDVDEKPVRQPELKGDTKKKNRKEEVQEVEDISEDSEEDEEEGKGKFIKEKQNHSNTKKPVSSQPKRKHKQESAEDEDKQTKTPHRQLIDLESELKSAVKSKLKEGMRGLLDYAVNQIQDDGIKPSKSKKARRVSDEDSVELEETTPKVKKFKKPKIRQKRESDDEQEHSIAGGGGVPKNFANIENMSRTDKVKLL